jgi:Na+-driven multidrug efflux pump
MLAAGFILFNAVSGTGKTQVSFFIEIITIIVYLAVTYILAEVLRSSIAVVWTVEFIYGVFLAVFSWLYLRFGQWKHSLV